MSDETLVDLWKVDQDKALEEIMSRYTNLLWSVVASMLGNIGTEIIIEDIISESFYYIWKNFHQFDHQKGSFKNWICLIAKSRSKNAIKKLANESKLRDKIKESYSQQHIVPLEQSVVQKEKLQHISKLIDSWKEPQKEISIRRYFYELTPREIAATMDLPIQKVNYYLYESKKKIKEDIKRYES